MGLKVIWVLELFTQNSVVVNFAVDGQSKRTVIVEQGLSSSVYGSSAPCCSSRISSQGVTHQRLQCSNVHAQGLIRKSVFKEYSAWTNSWRSTCTVGNKIPAYVLLARCSFETQKDQVDLTPVWTAMANAAVSEISNSDYFKSPLRQHENSRLGHPQCGRFEFLHIWMSCGS